VGTLREQTKESGGYGYRERSNLLWQVGWRTQLFLMSYLISIRKDGRLIY